MPPSPTVGALGVLVALLSLAALAAQPDAGAQATDPTTTPAPVRAAPSSEQLRALREGGRLNLNRASAGDLQLLPGIGPALAHRIVRDRETRGAYDSVADLERVRGIGAHRLAEIGALVDVDASVVEQPDDAERHREVHGVGVERSR